MRSPKTLIFYLFYFYFYFYFGHINILVPKLFKLLTILQTKPLSEISYIYFLLLHSSLNNITNIVYCQDSVMVQYLGIT